MVWGFFEEWDLWNSGFPCDVYWEIIRNEQEA